MLIRNATKKDLKAIVDIYNASIPNRLATADTQPVTVASRVEWFNQHSPTTYPIWAVEVQDSVVGWLSFSQFYGRPAYRSTAELSIYIAPDYQQQGIGKTLLQEAIASSPSLGIDNLLGFIFAHNRHSLTLFQREGFQQWGYLPQVATLDRIKRDLVILGKTLV